MDNTKLKLLNRRDNLLTFRKVGGETIHEIWQRFQKIFQTCPTHGMSNELLLEFFYRGLSLKNRSTVNHLFAGCLVHKPYKVVS